MSDTNYPNLRQMLGGYLHQDWRIEFSSANGAINAFKNQEPQAIILKVCDELNRVIPSIQQMRNPEKFLREELWCDYDPLGDGLTVVAWLQEVRKILCAHWNGV